MLFNLRLFIILVFSILSCITQPVHAEVKGTAAQAQAMVQKTVAAMKVKGVDAVIAEINKHDGQYAKYDLYIVVYDMTGKSLAHLNTRMIGKDMSELTDVDGKYFIKERIEIATKKGSGWQDYKFINPISKQIELKSMYIEKYKDVIIGCGFYK